VTRAIALRPAPVPDLGCGERTQQRARRRHARAAAHAPPASLRDRDTVARPGEAPKPRRAISGRISGYMAAAAAAIAHRPCRSSAIPAIPRS
jgi:hypothetical protein